MVHVDITPNDIRCGMTGNTTRCPVALAMLRALHAVEPNRYEVVVGGSSFIIRDLMKNEEKCYETPPEAVHFIVAYDDRQPVTPFKFQFDIHSGVEYHGRRVPFYSFGGWHQPLTVAPKPFKVPLSYGFSEIKYEKIISLKKDIEEVKEVKEPTTDELMEFINKSELSFDHQLVKV